MILCFTFFPLFGAPIDYGLIKCLFDFEIKISVLLESSNEVAVFNKSP